MSSFSEVKQAVCQILKDDGRTHNGTAFFILPGGYLLTCHHVVFGLKHLQIKIRGEQEPHEAEYLEEYSDPVSDFAVLRVPDVTVTPVQLGCLREGCVAYGYGYRPSSIAVEPEGHSFSGQLGPGQQLRFPVPSQLKAQLEHVAKEERQRWNVLPDEFRVGDVRNFQGTGGLEQGISGGPIYDPQLRRVVGLFRAVEGDERAYVIPMDNVFDRWRDLEGMNKAEVPDETLDQFADFGVRLVREGAKPIRPLLCRYFKEIFAAHEVFGGRQKELERLNRFVDERQSGYLFITGPAGFGKTALLTNWSQALASRQVETAVHFITTRIDEGAEAKFCFENLCEQLLPFHRLGGDLFSLDVKRLRALYADMLVLSPPPESRIIVILDGLDEALGRWQPGQDMFPHDLPEGIQVVFSARTVADKDWLAELNLPLSNDRVLTLGQLNFDELKDVLIRSKLVSGNDALRDRMAQRLYELTEGDPFYLQDLLFDLKQSGGDVEQLKEYPIGHNKYLRQWWKDAYKECGEQAFTDLMGTLAVARAPLSRDELICFSNEDALRGDNFDVLIERAARYVSGSETEGYQLSHGRIREFIYDRLVDKIRTYQSRMADYCLQWTQPDLADRQRDYMLLHGAYHLADAGSYEKLLQLLGPQWLHKKWERFGSFSSFIQDLDIAAIAALKQEPPDFASVAAFSVARQTARELMLNFPTPLLAAWVRLGEIERVLALLGALGEVKGRAVEPLTVVAAELLDLKKDGEAAVDLVNHAQVAADLLGRALGMLPLVRSSSQKRKSLMAITNLLGAENGLADSQRIPLLDQAQAFAQSLREPALQAASLCLVAEAMAPSESHKEQVHRLMDEVRQVISKIDYAPDRMVAMAHLLPVFRKLDPSAMLSTVRSAIQVAADPFEYSSLDKVPLRTLLMKWEPGEAPEKEEAATLLTEIGELCVNRAEPDGFVVGHVVRALCELGQGTMAVDLIRSLWERSAHEGARAVLEATQALHAVNPDATADWLDKAQEFTDSSHYDMPINREFFTGSLVDSLAIIGEWNAALSLLGTVQPMERVNSICECLRLVSASFTTELHKMQSIIARLIELGKDTDADEQAKINAVAAQVLIPHDLTTAKRYTNHAIGLCLTNLPEGDTDDLRQLLAIALHEDGDYTSARAVAKQMKWGMNAVETYTRLIEITPSTEAGALADYVEGILDTLRATEKDILFHMALQKATRAIRNLSERLPAAARTLCDYVFEAARNLHSYNDFVKCIAAESAARIHFDEATGLFHFDRVIQSVHEWLESNVHVSVHAVQDIYENMGTILTVTPMKALSRLEQAASLMDFFPSTEDKVKLGSTYAVALASVDYEQAVTILRTLLGAGAELGQTPSPAPHLTRRISEFVGEIAGPRYLQAQATKDIGAAIVTFARHCPDEAVELMRELLAAICKIVSPNDMAQALADFFDNCGKGAGDLHPRLSDLYNTALEKARTLPEPSLTAHALSPAVNTFCKFGHFEDAQRVAHLLDDTDARDSAENKIAMEKERMEIGTLSPLDRAFVDVPDSDLPYAVLHAVRVEGEVKKALMVLAEKLAYDRIPVERGLLISKFVRVWVIPAWELGGTDLIASIVRGIEDFDQRFIEAASLIAQQSG